MPVVDQGAAVHLRLTARMQEARDLPALSFVLCNELRALVEYRQAAIVGCGTAGRGTLLAHSGLVAVDADTPFALWIGEMVDALRPALIGLPPEAAMRRCATRMVRMPALEMNGQEVKSITSSRTPVVSRRDSASGAVVASRWPCRVTVRRSPWVSIVICMDSVHPTGRPVPAVRGLRASPTLRA
jgi:hypothetical protein